MEPADAATVVARRPVGSGEPGAATGAVFTHEYWRSLCQRIGRAKGAAAKLALARKYASDAARGPIINFYIAARSLHFSSLQGTPEMMGHFSFSFRFVIGDDALCFHRLTRCIA